MAQVSVKKSISLGGSNYKWGGGTSFCEEVNLFKEVVIISEVAQVSVKKSISLGGSNYKWGGGTSFSKEVNLFRR